VANKTELWGGATLAAIIGGAFVLLVDKVLRIETWTEHLPILPRVFFVVLMVLAVILGRRYYVILEGADEPHNSEDRARYDSLRERLRDGGTPAIVYNRWLAFALEKVDRFFGDAGRSDRSWIARTLHLETSGPRWTAEAFDKCLLLALVYPVVTIFAVWTYSGHVGIAEHALLLPTVDDLQGHPAFRRVSIFFLTALAVHGLFRAGRSTGVKGLIWVVGALAAFYASDFLGASTVLALGVWICGSIAVFASVFFGVYSVTGAFAVVAAVAVSIALALAVDIAYAAFGNFAGLGSLFTTVAILSVSGAAVAAAIGRLAAYAERKHQLSIFLLLLWAFTSAGCLVVPYILAERPTWTLMGGFLLFFGLLTLVNAPIDWIAVGFTRALLRRGLSQGSWWPFLYALIDVAVATILIALLAFAMVLAVQTFDDVAVLRAGPEKRILPLGPLFDGLTQAPGDYEYWWLWCLLFSSMIPSLLNLSIAAAAFLRGLPRVNAWVVQRVPVGKTMRQSDRLMVSAALAAQLVGGVALTGVATYLAGVYLLPLWLPAFGAVVRDFAADLAVYNAPARTIIWLSSFR
jgi:hypothetical protein